MAGSEQNPLVDIGTTTVQAFNIIKNQEKKGKSAMLGVDDTIERTPNHSVRVWVYTPQDKKKHYYFHSLSIDKQVEDFMGTAEIKCPYDSDLMEYWEPIRNYCVIYGSNQGEKNAKILFIGRVRELKQEGYELVITFQDYGWKFKQLVTQSYANDNVINKDGYTIMKLMFEALKIDSWVISPSAKYRLKQVGYDSDGNVTLNKKKIEEMPDLLKRLQKSNPSKYAINKWTETNKFKESELHNIKNINYTLKYEKPTKVMKKIASEGSSSFAPGKSVYGTNYGQSSNNSGGGANGTSTIGSASSPQPPANLCSSIGNGNVIGAMRTVWSFQRGYVSDYSGAKSTIVNFAQNSPATYSAQAAPCLATMAKYCPRSDGVNAAQLIKNEADWKATQSGTSLAVSKGAVNLASQVVTKTNNLIQTAINTAKSWGSALMKGLFG